MRSTWTCTCGKTFRVSEAQAGQPVTCPWCDLVLGEALPETFASPTAFQAEEPTPHTALADPEVAVTAAEPRRGRAHGVGTEATDDVDISVRTYSTWIMNVAIGLSFFFASMAAVGYFLTGQMGPDLKDVALSQTRVLTNACNAYREKHQRFPDTLEVLLQRDEFGLVYIDDPNALIDPWNGRYQYDPKGPKNNGLKPDIWVVPPDGKEIGNWPRKQ